MPTTRFDEVRDYGFADQALALREHADLTQRALATHLQVSVRALQAWESGLSYPDAAHLKHLIALYLERGVLPTGQEEEAAANLWEAVRARAPRRLVPFDRTWFAALRGVTAPEESHPLRSAAGATRRDDWGEAPDSAALYGRVEELATLSRWLVTDHCRLVGVVGMGGIGKTLLAARLAREVAPQFAAVYWRSLRNAPLVEEWVAGAIASLSQAQAVPPDGFAARLSLLLELLEARRGLLVLDNLETILEPGASDVRYREGYAGYGEVLRRVGEHLHQGCLLLTGREAPPDLAPRAGERAPVRTLRLGGLSPGAGQALLQEKELVGDDAAWAALIARYSGNPLALSVVGETIGVVFGGDITTFLAQDTAVFGGIRQLLDEQVGRLSAVERAIGAWLAVEREPVGFADLVADLGPGMARGEVMEAVEGLGRRSLLERGKGGAITLQPVVLEYTTTRLVAALAEEILAGEPALLIRYALLKAQAKDYVRRSQERLIAQPVLERLRGSLGSAGVVEQRLVALLEGWRGRPVDEQGYGPGNVVNLLRLLRGHLRGRDLSRLSIRQAYLQDVVMQDASLSGSSLSETTLGDAFAAVGAIAVTADAAYVAAGTLGGEVRVWRIRDRALLTGVQGHAGGVMGMAFSADGQLLATGSMDGTMRLWETPSGRVLATMEGHSSGVWSVALSADGRLVAGGGQDGTVRLWETPSGRLLATLQGHTGPVWGVSLSADGRLVAGGGQDGTIRLWEAPSGRLLAILQGHTKWVMGVTLSTDGRLVASGSQDGTVRLWEAPSGRPLATFQGHTGPVWVVSLSADGRLLASGGQDGTVRLWEAPNGRPLATLQGHTDGVWGVALSGDGRLLASGSHDGTVRLWDAGIGWPLATVHGYTTGVWDVALSADGRLLASGSMDYSVQLWNAGSGSPLARLEGHTGGITGVALSADGRLLASGSTDGTIRFWTPSGSPLATLEGHRSGTSSVALTHDGRLLASGGQDRAVRLWEVPSGRPLATLEGHTGLVSHLAFSLDGRLLASGGHDGTVRLWDVMGRRHLATLEGHTEGVWGVALSADGRLLASSSMDRTVRLWDVMGRRHLATLEGHTEGVWGVALSADGRLLASSSFDQTVRLWEASSGRPLATLQGHTGVVYGVALSADGRLAASGSYDGTAKLWDTNSGACLRTLRGDRRYERMDISGLTGVTGAQRAALLALGAVDGEAPPDIAPTPD